MNTPLLVNKFEQYLSDYNTELTNALYKNYLQPYKSTLDLLLAKTTELNFILLRIPEHNTRSIELHINDDAVTLAPHQISTFQTLTQSYLNKLKSLANCYRLLENYALDNIHVTPYRGFFTPDNKLKPSKHLLFMITMNIDATDLPKVEPLYVSLELQQVSNDCWHRTRHKPKTLEETIGQVSPTTTILLVENPENLPLI